MTPTQRETIAEKAHRLKRNHRAIILNGVSAIVIGDHDTYQVSKTSGGRWTCNCPWGRYRSHWKDCSHITAVRRARKDPTSQAPVARLADWLSAAQNLTELKRGA